MFVDAYGRGQLLSQEDCLALVPFLTVPQPDMFNPVDPYKVEISLLKFLSLCLSSFIHNFLFFSLSLLYYFANFHIIFFFPYLFLPFQIRQ